MTAVSLRPFIRLLKPPQEFGIVSPPVLHLLNLTPQPHHEESYLRYVDTLHDIRRHYDVLERAADVDMALWSAAHLSLLSEYRALAAEMYGDEYFQELLDKLEPLLPGKGSLSERYAEFKQGFVIPPDRLDAVFRAAIDACRERALRHIDLPPDEAFRVEYVTDKSWSGYTGTRAVTTV